jgi:chromosome segregation ATPase
MITKCSDTLARFSLNHFVVMQSKIDSAENDSRKLKLKIRDLRSDKHALDKKLRLAASQTRKLLEENNRLKKREEFLRKEHKTAVAAAASEAQDELTEHRAEVTQLESKIAQLKKTAKNVC